MYGMVWYGMDECGQVRLRGQDSARLLNEGKTPEETGKHLQLQE